MASENVAIRKSRLEPGLKNIWHLLLRLLVADMLDGGQHCRATQVSAGETCQLSERSLTRFPSGFPVNPSGPGSPTKNALTSELFVC
jgi:hypothetical protein